MDGPRYLKGVTRMNRYAVEYDDATLTALSTTPEAFEGEARFLLAAKLYELGRLTSGQAAHLANMGRVEFLLGLKRAGVSAINMSAEELDDDVRHAGTE
jgi:predicted HTH domain antitoxin